MLKYSLPLLVRSIVWNQLFDTVICLICVQLYTKYKSEHSSYLCLALNVLNNPPYTITCHSDKMQVDCSMHLPDCVIFIYYLFFHRFFAYALGEFV